MDAKLPLSKPLNPNAKEFSLFILPHQMFGPKYVEQMPREAERTQPPPDMVPLSPQEMWCPPFYGHCQAMYFSDLTGMATVYPLPFPPTPYQPLGSGFYEASLNHRKMSKAEEKIEGKRPGQMGGERRRMVDPVPKSVKQEWRVKGNNKKGTGNTGVRPVSPFPETLEKSERFGITTAMIRNIPNQFRHEDLVEILDHHCYKENISAASDQDMSKYDLVYLPMDYRRRAYENRTTNLGYAFVNFTTSKAAFKFYEEYHGYKWQVTENRKTCEIARAAFQGKEELKKKFQKIFRCPCSKFLPVEYFPPRDGLNRRIRGSKVGKYVRGLPTTKLGN